MAKRHPAYDPEHIKKVLRIELDKALQAADLIILLKDESREEGHFRRAILHRHLTVGDLMVILQALGGPI